MFVTHSVVFNSFFTSLKNRDNGSSTRDSLKNESWRWQIQETEYLKNKTCLSWVVTISVKPYPLILTIKPSLLYSNNSTKGVWVIFWEQDSFRRNWVDDKEEKHKNTFSFFSSLFAKSDHYFDSPSLMETCLLTATAYTFSLAFLCSVESDEV